MELDIAPFISHLVDLLREGNAAFRWNKAGNAIIIDEAKAPEVRMTTFVTRWYPPNGVLTEHHTCRSFRVTSALGLSHRLLGNLTSDGFRRVKSAVKGIPAEYSHPLFRKGRSGRSSLALSSDWTPLSRSCNADLISQIRRKSSAEYSSKTETDLLRDQCQ